MHNRLLFTELHAAMEANDYDKVCGLLANNPALSESDVKQLSDLPLSPPIRETLEVYIAKEARRFEKGKAKLIAGDSPLDLISAIQQENIEEVEFLLAEGMDPKQIADASEERCVLSMAVLLGNKEIVDLLLAYGAQPNQPDKKGITPLFEAARTGQYAITESLLINGGDPHLVNPERKTPRQIALDNGHKEIANLLSITPRGQHTPLLIADAMGFGKLPGLCHGLGHMAKQSILADDIPTLNRRLVATHLMTNNARANAAEELGYPLDKIPSKSQNTKINALAQKKVKAYLGNSFDIKKNAIQEAEQEEIFLQAEYNKVVQQKIQDKTDVFAYYEDMILYQNLSFGRKQKFAELYGETTTQSISQQDQRTGELVLPNKLAKENAVPLCIDIFTGVYDTLQEMEYYCRLLREAIDKRPFAGNVAFTLTGPNHTITIGYNPHHKTWYFYDSNTPPVVKVRNEGLMARKIRQAFQSPVIIATHVHARTEDAVKMHDAMQEIKRHPLWQDMHRVTAHKANLRNHLDSRLGYTWQTVAVVHGDVEAVKQIHKEQSFFRRYWKSLTYFTITGLGIGGVIAAFINLYEDRSLVKEAERNRFIFKLPNKSESRQKYIRTHAKARDIMTETPGMPVSARKVNNLSRSDSVPIPDRVGRGDHDRNAKSAPSSPGNFRKK